MTDEQKNRWVKEAKFVVLTPSASTTAFINNGGAVWFDQGPEGGLSPFSLAMLVREIAEIPEALTHINKILSEMQDGPRVQITTNPTNQNGRTD